jgi:hypothetical protein
MDSGCATVLKGNYAVSQKTGDGLLTDDYTVWKRDVRIIQLR